MRSKEPYRIHPGFYTMQRFKIRPKVRIKQTEMLAFHFYAFQSLTEIDWLRESPWNYRAYTNLEHPMGCVTVEFEDKVGAMAFKLRFC